MWVAWLIFRDLFRSFKLNVWPFSCIPLLWQIKGLSSCYNVIYVSHRRKGSLMFPKTFNTRDVLIKSGGGSLIERVEQVWQPPQIVWRMHLYWWKQKPWRFESGLMLRISFTPNFFSPFFYETQRMHAICSPHIVLYVPACWESKDHVFAIMIKCVCPNCKQYLSKRCM